MANDKIDDNIFSIILQICKNNNTLTLFMNKS